MPKRENYISWDEYFMGIALLSAQRSKDPSTQVGACIVNQSNKIMSLGYNGLPAGCDDDEFLGALRRRRLRNQISLCLPRSIKRHT